MSSVNDLLEVFTKGMIAGGVFEEFATADDLRDILPDEAIAEIAKRVSAPERRGNEGESNMDIDLDALPEDVQEYITALEKRAADAAPATEDELVEEVLKGVDPAVAEIIKADRQRLAQAEAALATAEEQRTRQHFIAKAARFDGVVDDPSDFAEVLRDLQSVSPESAAKLEKALEAASERIMKGALFDELGSGFTGGENDAFDKATAIAKSWVEEGKYTSIDEARADVWESQPGLYAEYQAGR